VRIGCRAVGQVIATARTVDATAATAVSVARGRGLTRGKTYG